MDRRQFLGSAAIAACAGATSAGGADGAAKLRVVVIGNTATGGYGHGLDVAFAGRPDAEILAVADPVEAGREKARQRVGAARAYADYREMIGRERPDVVVVGPRTTGEHFAMTTAALRAGAHVFSEKPFMRTVAECDEALALADGKGLRVAVAHQMRMGPSVVHLKSRWAETMGELVAMRAFGKMDKRAGGEDLVVLGPHLFDLMRMFAGADPLWCTASVSWHGREATAADARPATEDVGPILGDEITAQFLFPGGVTGTFESRTRLAGYSGSWGVELVGTRGVARILTDIWPRVVVRDLGKWETFSRADAWKTLDGDPDENAPPERRRNGPANTRVVDDLVAAIREKREPVCSGRNAAWGIEMVHGVWRAGLARGRVSFPLAERGHPLERAKG